MVPSTDLETEKIQRISFLKTSFLVSVGVDIQVIAGFILGSFFFVGLFVAAGGLDLTPDTIPLDEIGESFTAESQATNQAPSARPISVCSNAICEYDEDYNSCPMDCSAATCGNDICDAGETSASCPFDCGEVSSPGTGSAPTLTDISDISGAQGTHVEVALTAADAEGDSITYELGGDAVDFLQVSSRWDNTGALIGVLNEIGNHAIQITARDIDGNASAPISVNVTVTAGTPVNVITSAAAIPYTLTGAGKKHVLTTDITAATDAFDFASNTGQHLYLNGHTINFNTSAALQARAIDSSVGTISIHGPGAIREVGQNTQASVCNGVPRLDGSIAVKSTSSGLTLHDVEIRVRSDESEGVYMRGGSNIVYYNELFDRSVPDADASTCNREYVRGLLEIELYGSGLNHYYKNYLRDSRASAIYGSQDPDPTVVDNIELRVEDNRIIHKQGLANNFAIGGRQLSKLIVKGNTITGTGSGVGCDGPAECTVLNNHIDLWGRSWKDDDGPGPNGSDNFAYGVQAEGPDSVSIQDNYIRLWGWAQPAPTDYNYTGQTSGFDLRLNVPASLAAPYVIANNTLVAQHMGGPTFNPNVIDLNYGLAKNFFSVFSLTSYYSTPNFSNNLTVTGNTLRSNQAFVHHEQAGYGVPNTLPATIGSASQGNTFEKIGPSQSWAKPWEYTRFHDSPFTDLRFLNPQILGGANLRNSTRVGWTTLVDGWSVSYTARATVTDTSGNPLSGVVVQAVSHLGQAFSDTTDALGRAELTVPEFRREANGTTTLVNDEYNPYTFTVSRSGYATEVFPITMDQERDLGVTLQTTGQGGCSEVWECTEWSACSNSQQSRTCTDHNSCGTTTNRPALTQSCTPAACTENWNCTAWSACTNSAQTRTCTDANSCGTTVNRPALTQSCQETGTCQPTWTCTNWNACSNGTQTRACSDDNSCGTEAGRPTISQACEVAAPLCEPRWSCGDWSACGGGAQTRSCEDANTCGTPAPISITRRTCNEPTPVGGPDDTVAPETTVNDVPTAITNNQVTVSWSGSDNRTATENLVFTYRLDDIAWIPVGRATSHTFTDLTNGSHTLDVQAYDEAGNADPSPSRVTFTVERVLSIVTGTNRGGIPQVRVFNAAGEVKQQFYAFAKSFRGGVNVATGDVDGDGIDEIITGAGRGGGPHVRVFTVQGKLRYQFFAYPKSFRGGVNVAVGDIDEDGRDEVIVAPQSGGGPTVRAFDVVNGTLDAQFTAFAKSFRGGVSVTAGDLNRDGRDEVIVAPASNGGPHVRVFTLDREGVRVLTQFYAGARDIRGGLSLRVADVLGDPRPEILTAATDGKHPAVTRLFDGNGVPQEQFNVTEGDFRGGITLGSGDIFNLDNIEEIITGGYSNSVPGVFLIQRTGANTYKRIRTFSAYAKSFRGGINVATGHFGG